MNKLMIAALVAGVGFGSAVAEVKLPAKEKFKIVVLAGQSNMAGRGTVDPADNKPHPRVLMLNQAGEWVPCIDPIHYDIRNSGVGPGKFFGEMLAESDPSITVGLVPTAVGGTPLQAWVPGGKSNKGGNNWHPYDDMVARTKKAMEKGTLAAILWHQGESDCMRRCGYLYQVRFPEMIARFRKDVGAEGVPLVCGGLHPKMESSWFGKILANAKRWTCEYAYGPGKYTTCPDDVQLQPDNIHYTKASQQEFAKRYFAAYQDVVKALAADKEYWKKPENPSAQIKAYAIPDWKAKDAATQIGLVPETLPEPIEKWVFPKGRPAKQ